MAYYSGQVASYQELLDALVAACVAEGWIWTDGILSKGESFVRLYTQTGSYSGVLAQGGTGKTNSSLVNPSGVSPRLGRPAVLGQGQNSNVTWPAQYYIHIFNDPDEVWLILHHSIDAFWKLAFGYSELPSTGLWITGTASHNGPSQSSAAKGSFAISPTGTGYNLLSTGMPFWQTGNSYPENIVYIDNDWVWVRGSRDLNAIDSIQPLISRQPSNWNSEAILLPINVCQIAASSKRRFVVQVRHARYLRIDNYEPNQTLTLGNEEWKIYPGVRKNLAYRDGGGGSNGSDHTGTFGIAIRYDGP